MHLKNAINQARTFVKNDVLNKVSVALEETIIETEVSK